MAAQVRAGGQEVKKQPLHWGCYRAQTEERWAGVGDGSKEAGHGLQFRGERKEAVVETRIPACETHLELQLQQAPHLFCPQLPTHSVTVLRSWVSCLQSITTGAAPRPHPFESGSPSCSHDHFPHPCLTPRYQPGISQKPGRTADRLSLRKLFQNSWPRNLVLDFPRKNPIHGREETDWIQPLVTWLGPTGPWQFTRRPEDMARRRKDFSTWP